MLQLFYVLLLFLLLVRVGVRVCLFACYYNTACMWRQRIQCETRFSPSYYGFQGSNSDFFQTHQQEPLPTGPKHLLRSEVVNRKSHTESEYVTYCQISFWDWLLILKKKKKKKILLVTSLCFLRILVVVRNEKKIFQKNSRKPLYFVIKTVKTIINTNNQVFWNREEN